MFDLTRVRADLPAVRRVAYLNTGTFGPLAEATRRAVVDYVDQATDQGRTGASMFESLMALIGEARAGLAGAVGAAPDDIALTHSTSDGINAVLSGLDWEPGDVVVTTASEHPGLTEPLASLTRRRGVVVREVVVEGVDDPTAAVVAAIGERTRIVAVSHVLWTEGTVLDARALADASHDAGVPLLLDGAQGAGCIALDLPATGCDYYTISGQKWLQGPSATGGLYVRPEAVEAIEPAWPTYMTRDQHAEGGPAAWPGARRFDIGSITLAALAGLVASLAWRQETGVGAATGRAAELARGLRSALDGVPGARAVPSPSPSPLVAIEVDGDPGAVVAGLDERGVMVRSVPGRPWVRASVGCWNDEDDLDRLVEGLRAVSTAQTSA